MEGQEAWKLFKAACKARLQGLFSGEAAVITVQTGPCSADDTPDRQKPL